MMIETGFTFTDHTTDNTPTSPSPIPNEFNGLSEQEIMDTLPSIVLPLLGEVQVSVRRMLGGDERANLLALTALTHTMNRAFELAAPISTMRLLDENPETAAWIPGTLGCATMSDYYQLMPDTQLLMDALRKARQSGESQTVFLPDGNHTIRVNPDGVIEIKQEETTPID